MSTIDVTSGQFQIGITLANGDLLNVQNGGTVESTVILDGGNEHVFAAGTDENAAVDAGGTLLVDLVGRSFMPNVNGGVLRVAGVVEGAMVRNQGRISVLSQGEAFHTTIGAVGAQIVQSGGSAGLGTITAGGTQFLQSGATVSHDTIQNGGLEIVAMGATAQGERVEGGGTLVLCGPGGATDTTILDGGTLDLAFLNYAAGGTASLGDDGLLTVIDNGTTYTQQLDGSYAGLTPVLVESFASSVGVTLLQAGHPPCFAAGTRLATVDGPVAVEALRVGDVLLTASGAARPVVWIGFREIVCGTHPDPDAVRPVRVRAHAFDAGVPARDVLLSPDHAVFAEGVLIPVRLLVDGAAILRTAQDTVRYYHVELDAHDVVLADGLPVESYLDTGNRAAFANGGAVVDLHADFAPAADETAWEALACAPLRVTGPELERVRARLRVRARRRAWLRARGAAPVRLAV